ncbi:MAG: DUF2971 domain-containing protein [Desulfobaccales bacterium]|jgi:hypothetical protein
MSTHLYHYTNNEAFIKIIINNCLRLSHFYFQNDPNELRYGLDLLLETRDEMEKICAGAKEYIETIAHESVEIEGLPIFTFSLSEKDDLLSQWRGYGSGNKSVCIGLIKDDLKNILNDNIIKIDISKVIYDKNDQMDKLIEYFKQRNELYKNTNAMSLSLLANLSNYSDLINIIIEFKHNKWEEEQEWRLIAATKDDSMVNFLGDSKWLKPYIDLKYDKIPITNIKIPRSGYENKNKSSIEMFLIARGKEKIAVNISDIPIVY